MNLILDVLLDILIDFVWDRVLEVRIWQPVEKRWDRVRARKMNRELTAGYPPVTAVLPVRLRREPGTRGGMWVDAQLQISPSSASLISPQQEHQDLTGAQDIKQSSAVWPDTLPGNMRVLSLRIRGENIEIAVSSKDAKTARYGLGQHTSQTNPPQQMTIA